MKHFLKFKKIVLKPSLKRREYNKIYYNENDNLIGNAKQKKINHNCNKRNFQIYVLPSLFVIYFIFNIIILFKYYKEKAITKKLNDFLDSDFLSPLDKQLIRNELFPIKNKNIKINKPFLPKNPIDKVVHNYSKTYYNDSNIRYHLDELYSNRTLYEIDYSYLPYTKIDKSLSYDQNADYIYNLTGILNMTLLDFYYNGIDIDKTQFNHIHLSMGFDANYVLLSSVSIASILNNSNPNTFIHLHIILNNCSYKDVKPIIDLKKINNNIEFIFYNGKQAEYDFQSRSKGEWRGVGDYARVLIPEIVNNTNRVIIIDSGDLLVNKDLSELYFFDIGDNYFAFSLDEYAGTSIGNILFAHNNFYPNTGVCLVNIRKYRRDNLYRSSFFTAMGFNDLPCPYQDIFIMISNFKFKFWGLNYNSPEFFRSLEDRKEGSQVIRFDTWYSNQKSPYKYSKNELREAALNPVVTHLYHTKPYKNEASPMMQEKWRKYANLTGLYDQIKAKYPAAF